MLNLLRDMASTLTKKKRKLKLYVWEGILRDYSCGMACALAYSEDHARRLVEKKLGYAHGDLLQKPKRVTKPEGFVVYGGG